MIPTRFFHESENQYTSVQIKEFVNKHGKNILIGGDPGHDDFDNTMLAAARLGCKRHVYLVGPGMKEWSRKEAEEIRRNARSIGIDTDDPNWEREWYSTGWVHKCEEWFVIYNTGGFYSAEIDNIDAALKNDPKKLVEFYHHLFNFCKRNKIITKLMVKNLSLAELKAVAKEPPELLSWLAPFGMFEKGSGDSKQQTKLAASIGIQAVTPLNGLRPTERYGTVETGVKYSIGTENA